MKCLFTQLDSRGINYVENEMKVSNYLGKEVLARVKLTDGHAFALVPENHEPDIYRFRSSVFPNVGRERTNVPGGHVESVPTTSRALVSWVHGVLKADLSRLFVCESYLLRAKDLARVSNLPRRTIVAWDFAYHCAVGNDPTEEIAAAVEAVYPVPLGFALISSPAAEPLALVAGTSFTQDELTMIASTVATIIVGAYDGESVLLWQKRPTRQLIC